MEGDPIPSRGINEYPEFRNLKGVEEVLRFPVWSLLTSTRALSKIAKRKVFIL